MCLCYLFSAKTAWQLVNRKANFFYKTNRFELIRVTNGTESIRIANWNALVQRRSLLLCMQHGFGCQCVSVGCGLW